MEKEGRFMIIKMGTAHYGLRINEIKEVVPNTEIVNVRNEDSVYIYGIMESRYGCVSVLDIYNLFHTQPVSMPELIVTVFFGEVLLAFPVEKVECVVDVLPERLHDIPQIFNNKSQQYVQTIIELDGKLIPVLDTKSLFEKTDILSEIKVVTR